MHRTLFDPERFPNIQAYFDTIDYQSSDQNEYLLQTGVEDTYIYLVSHVFMHYLASGTGLRSLLDIRLFLTRYENEMDLSYIESQLKKLGADDFEKKIRNISNSVSEPGDLSDEDKSLLDGFIFSGTYGTKKNWRIVK